MRQCACDASTKVNHSTANTLKLLKMRFKIYLGIIFIFTIYYKVTFSKFIFENYSSTTASTTCGKILPQPYTRSRITCSKMCLSKLWCTGILFNPNAIINEKCQIIFPACAYSINQINWNNYKLSKVSKCSQVPSSFNEMR